MRVKENVSLRDTFGALGEDVASTGGFLSGATPAPQAGGNECAQQAIRKLPLSC
jgi:hypothetical protein